MFIAINLNYFYLNLPNYLSLPISSLNLC